MVGRSDRSCREGDPLAVRRVGRRRAHEYDTSMMGVVMAAEGAGLAGGDCSRSDRPGVGPRTRVRGRGLARRAEVGRAWPTGCPGRRGRRGRGAGVRSGTRLGGTGRDGVAAGRSSFSTPVTAASGKVPAVLGWKTKSRRSGVTLVSNGTLNRTPRCCSPAPRTGHCAGDTTAEGCTVSATSGRALPSSVPQARRVDPGTHLADSRAAEKRSSRRAAAGPQATACVAHDHRRRHRGGAATRTGDGGPVPT